MLFDPNKCTRVLHRDFETKSAVSLTTVGAWRYAADPTTEILCVGFAIDDGPVRIWIPGQPIPTEFLEAARDPRWLVVSHNDQFETAIETRLLHPRHGWPLIPRECHRCTMAAALANALPGSLEGAAAALGLGLHKRKMPKPEETEQLHQYCAWDVEIERELYRRLPPLSPAEQRLWTLDGVVNERGFRVDRELAQAALEIVRAEQAAIRAEIAVLTEGSITSPNQVARILTFARERGHEMQRLGKRNVGAVLAGNPSDDVRRLLELRRDGAPAAARKLDSLFAGLDPDDRLRGTLKFHAAATGRWSGNRFQPQNLKKPKVKDLDAAVEAVMSGDINRVRALGAPLDVVGDISRSMIVAASGHVLFIADFSAIESRVLAWIAGEEWKLEAYRRSDAGEGPELYCLTAAKVLGRPVTPDDQAGRDTGKTCDLAFGFGGGLGAWRRFDSSDTHTDADIIQFKNEWRRAHGATVKFWNALETAARRAIRGRQRVTLGALAAELEGSTLYITLPSGRRLAYPEARIGPGKFEGAAQVIFKDNARGAWKDVRGWRGSFTENVVSGISRDLLAAAMIRLEAAGYAIVLHVHDEIVAEVPIGHGNLEGFQQLMIESPGWASGLPIAAKARISKRYAGSRPQAEQQVLVGAGEDVVLGDPGWHPHNGAIYRRVACATDKPSQEEKQLPHLASLVEQPWVDGKLSCPFHDDGTPSLHIYEDHYHCFGCGAHGDRVDWLMFVHGLSRAEALDALERCERPPVRLRREDDARTLASALRLWEDAGPIAGTVAVRYLADARRIDVDALPTGLEEVLRFHPRCPFGVGTRHPCLIALFRDVRTNAPAGIHRIALTSEGGKIERKSLGRWAGVRAIKLWPAGAQLVVGEGLETVLAAATRISYGGAPLRPAWAMGPGGSMAKLPVLPDVERLIILVDNDETGRAVADRCEERWRCARHAVVRLTPKRPGEDFNDIVLRGSAS
jgi:DNA polymerase